MAFKVLGAGKDTREAQEGPRCPRRPLPPPPLGENSCRTWSQV